MTTINSSTFMSDSILFIRDYLRTNLTDPLARTGGIGFVMTAFPKRETIYPVVTTKITNCVTNKLGMQSETSLLSLSIEVRIFSRNSKECDNITQQVIDKLRTFQFDTLGTSNSGMYGFKLDSCNSIVQVDGDNTIHNKVLNFNYKEILE